MKNITFLFLRLAFITGLIFLTVQSYGCKKKKSTPAEEPTVTVPDSTQYTISVNSNYKYPYITIENVSDNSDIKRFNSGSYTNMVIINYSFWIKNSKKYRVYTYSTKNSSDSTFNMTDNKTVWNSLKVSKGSDVVYNYKDSIGYGSWRITGNEYKINY